jgi:hypothetical protein
MVPIHPLALGHKLETAGLTVKKLKELFELS